MVISTKGRYALRLMIDLAQHCDEGFISLKTVSQRQDVSLKYMEAIAAALNRANLVISQRGKEGGYRLSRPASDITVAEVLHSTEGSMAAVSCLESGENGCERAAQCLTLPIRRVRAGPARRESVRAQQGERKAYFLSPFFFFKFLLTMREIHGIIYPQNK